VSTVCAMHAPQQEWGEHETTAEDARGNRHLGALEQRRGRQEAEKMTLRPRFVLSLSVLLLLLSLSSVGAAGENEASPTEDGVEESDSNLRQPKKRIGRFRRKEDLTALLFPGASPVS